MVNQNNHEQENNKDTQENVEVIDKVYTKKDVIRGGIIGWGLGVATTLLLAPKSGKELRGDISYQVGSAKDKAVDKSKDLGYSAMDKYDEIKESATNQTKKLKDKMNLGKNKNKDEESSNEEDSENNSQLQSNAMENAMGNDEQEEEQATASEEKKPSTKSKATADRKPTKKRRTSSNQGSGRKARSAAN